MAERGYLGVDIGTSGVKAILVAEEGDVLATYTEPLRLATPEPGWAEQDPDAWWAASCTAIRGVLAQEEMEVQGVGLTGQMHSSVFLDAAGEVIRPALLWCDGRTTAQCRTITERVGGEAALRDLVRNPALEGFTLPKVLWLREHEPAAYERLTTLLLAKDFIRYRLTGALATEPSDASGTLMFDPARMNWSAEVLDAVDVPASMLPDLGGSAEILGRVHAEAARATGLPEGAPVVGGGSDNGCGAAGVGVVRPGQAVASWGTSGTVLAPVDEPYVDPELRAHTFCHVAEDTWYIMGVVLSAGGAFAWYRDRFGRGAGADSDDDLARALNEEAAAAPRGAGGVTFLPYLQGERTPHRDSSARGALLGLSLAHDRSHISRAVNEGICFAMRDSLEILRAMELAPEELLLTGGGARSPFIRRLQAEIYGLPVRTVDREEGPAYGAALLAAVGVGAFEDLAQAVDSTLTPGPLEVPEPGSHEEYERPYAQYRDSFVAATLTGRPAADPAPPSPST